jgi:YNFM family putative membrane transporter
MMSGMSTPPISAGSPEFRRINRAMVFGGFSTFALLYCVQPLMPLLAHDFALTPAQSSLALSVATGTLAISLLASSVLSERFGRKPLMAGSMFCGGVLTLLAAFAQDYGQLLLLRGLLGLLLGGMPALAMAYLSEEIAGPSLGHSMGLYAAWEFNRSLPASRNFRGGQGGWRALFTGTARHVRDAGLPWLFSLSFLLMGVFVSMYNYIGYRLLAPSFGLRQSAVGALSILYLLGIFSSVWAGKLADRLGRRNVLWMVMLVMLGGLLLTLSDAVLLIVIGMGLFTFGFFASHSVCSSWVGRRARPPQALASALYLFFYYLGSSVVGWVSGVVWARAGWPGVVSMLGAVLLAAMAVALRLRGLAPLDPLKPLDPANAG